MIYLDGVTLSLITQDRSDNGDKLVTILIPRELAIFVGPKLIGKRVRLTIEDDVHDQNDLGPCQQNPLPQGSLGHGNVFYPGEAAPATRFVNCVAYDCHKDRDANLNPNPVPKGFFAPEVMAAFDSEMQKLVARSEAFKAEWIAQHPEEKLDDADQTPKAFMTPEMVAKMSASEAVAWAKEQKASDDRQQEELAKAHWKFEDSEAIQGPPETWRTRKPMC